jgi:hypothetical protein
MLGDVANLVIDENWVLTGESEPGNRQRLFGAAAAMLFTPLGFVTPVIDVQFKTFKVGSRGSSRTGLTLTNRRAQCYGLPIKDMEGAPLPGTVEVIIA